MFVQSCWRSVASEFVSGLVFNEIHLLGPIFYDIMCLSLNSTPQHVLLNQFHGLGVLGVCTELLA